MKRRIAIAGCLLAAAVPVLAQDASGTWDLSVVRTGDPARNTSMTIKKDGDRLSGTLVGPQEAQLPISGTQAGADVTISFNVTTQDGTFAITLKGRQDGEAMKGRLEIGGQDQGEWTASRAGAAAAAAATAADLTGSWTLAVTTPQGSGSPSVTLKQQGAKLTGRYKGMFGEAPVTGEVKGQSFSFSTTMNIEGNSVTLTYSGTVKDGALAGRVTFGDFTDGTFTGKKGPPEP